MFKLNRTEESKLTSWYFETDRTLLGLVLFLMLVAMLMAISSGSAMFVRTVNLAHSIQWYDFFLRMIPYYLIGVLTLFWVSMRDKKTVLTLAWLDLGVFFILLIGTVVFPHSMNNSHRWFVIPGLPHVMPSDLMKPGFVMITAWFIAKMREIYGDDMFNLKRTAFQVKTWSWVWYLVPLMLVLAIQFWHPDFGTMLLYVGTLGVMLVMAGLPAKWTLSLIGGGIGLLILGITFLPHVRNRTLDLFGPVDPRSQIGFALRAIRNGGLFGAGDKAYIVENLPMAESDFVLSGICENFGAIASCGLILVMGFVFWRLFHQSKYARDDFISNAIVGTAAMFGIQVCINLASTLRLMPAKGMTLPFVSHGGSSFVAYCLLFGMVLALIREDKWR
ncbi:MAG: FtsW/RodA/SpoVE family cell cycle protein [Alphaproteobacteria bacterium]|nr:FtsW/RodA/SpoVE family cell cycle protein [Alphaproteobacteria bacterium]